MKNNVKSQTKCTLAFVFIKSHFQSRYQLTNVKANYDTKTHFLSVGSRKTPSFFQTDPMSLNLIDPRKNLAWLWTLMVLKEGKSLLLFHDQKKSPPLYNTNQGSIQLLFKYKIKIAPSPPPKKKLFWAQYYFYY